MFRDIFDTASPAACNEMVDGEMQQAGIPLISINDNGDRYTIGVLQFGDTQSAVVKREPKHYSITFAKLPTADQGRQIDAIDGVSESGFERFHRHGTELAGVDLSVRSWCVNTQAGLNALVRRLQQFYGKPNLDLNQTSPAFESLVRLLAELELSEPQKVEAE